MHQCHSLLSNCCTALPAKVFNCIAKVRQIQKASVAETMKVAAILKLCCAPDEFNVLSSLSVKVLVDAVLALGLHLVGSSAFIPVKTSDKQQIKPVEIC